MEGQKPPKFCRGLFSIDCISMNATAPKTYRRAKTLSYVPRNSGRRNVGRGLTNAQPSQNADHA